MSSALSASSASETAAALALNLAGRAGLVQGAGGNISVKDDGVLWIKASGTRFKDAASRDIFVGLDLASARRTVLESEDLAGLVIAGPTGLRPSIETAIHALLPHRVVAHVHAIGAIAAAIDTQASAVAAQLADLGRVWFVPYAKPGIQLAGAILRVVDPVDPNAPCIVLLGNHGLIVAAEDASIVEGIIAAVESRWAPELLSASVRPTTTDAWWTIVPPGSVTAEQALRAAAGPYTPDEAVFLGARPFWDERTATQPCPDDTLVKILDDGSALARGDISDDAAEIAVSILDVLRGVRPGHSIATLPDHRIAELVDWDAERWRKQQAR